MQTTTAARETARAEKSLKILLVTSATDGGNWLYLSARYLKARGHSVSVLLPQQKSLSARLSSAGIQVEIMPIDVAYAPSQKEQFFQCVNALADHISKNDYDVVEYCLFPALVVARLASWQSGVKTRVQRTTGPYNMGSPILNAIERASCWMDTTILATSQLIKKQYRSIGASEKRVPVIYFGHDPESFEPRSVDRSSARIWLSNQFKVPVDAPVVTMVSWFYPRLPDSIFIPRHLRGKSAKNHEMIIEAAPLVLSEKPDAYILLVGDSWGEESLRHIESLKQRCRELGVEERVIFTGFVERLETLIAATDVAVQCSSTENIAGTVIEAFLMERPVVATRVGALPEAVVDGENGFLVEDGDHAGLARSIIRLINDPGTRRRFGVNGRQKVLREHTLDVVMPELEKRYLKDASRRLYASKLLTQQQRKRLTALMIEVVYRILEFPYNLSRLPQIREELKLRLLNHSEKS